MSQVFIVDSAPLPVCKISRAKRSSICSTDTIKPAFEYCASQKIPYFGYKIHAVCNENAVIHSFDLIPANIHDIHYLKDVKYNISNCEFIGDKGCFSADYQLDLFTNSRIELHVPMKKNQHNFTVYSKRKRKIRKRIETLISQLDGQFSMNINFAKTLGGFATRILSKITAITLIQLLNMENNRNINNIKINIA